MAHAYLTIAGVALGLTACLGVDHSIGVDEPMVVHQGTFRKAKLPGTAEAQPGAPKVTSTTLATGSFNPGAPDVSLSGRVSADAYSVGVRFLDRGTGYWVVPAGAEDILTPGELTYELSFDVGSDVEPGPAQLGVVAFDERGKAGQQNRIDVCVLSDLPDNRNVCKPENEPPAAIAALRWNTDADLDLIVIAPDGTRYGRSNFSQLDGDEVVARLDADANSGCALDGKHIENFAWLEQPQKGTWYIYANLFDACQKQAVRFELTTYRKHDNGDGTFALNEEKSVAGEILRAQTQPDAARPLYLGKIEFP